MRFFANATGSITPVLLESMSGSDFSVAAVGDPIDVTAIGLNEAAVFFPTLGSLTPGATYLFGYQDSASGVVATHSTATASGSWLAASTSAAVSTGTSAAFSTAAVRSLDIIASTTSGSAAADSNAAAFDTSSGSVAIDPTTTFSAGFLPTAMQVQAELPAGVDSAFVTPLVFAVGGTSAAPTYTLIGAATSQLLSATGVAQLPVEFAPSLLSSLSTDGSYVMGFSTVDVQIATGGRDHTDRSLQRRRRAGCKHVRRQLARVGRARHDTGSWRRVCYSSSRRTDRCHLRPHLRLHIPHECHAGGKSLGAGEPAVCGRSDNRGQLHGYLHFCRSTQH